MQDIGLGYPGSGDLALRAATKPVSGEPILSSLDRMEAITGHGTKAGYDEGCRGSHCPGKERVGMSCAQAQIRYQGDMSYRRRVDAGLSAEAIWEDDKLDGTVMPKPNAKDRRGESVFEGEQSTVEDSVEDDRLFEDVAPAVLVKVAQTPERAVRSPQRPPVAVEVPVVSAVPAAPSRGPRWAVRKVWVAVSPDGKLDGPHESREAAFAVVEAALRPKKAAPSNAVEGKPKRVRRPWTEQDTATLTRLHADGLSGQKIAEQMGRLPQVVLARLRMMGLQTNGTSFGRKP